MQYLPFSDLHQNKNTILGQDMQPSVNNSLGNLGYALPSNPFILTYPQLSFRAQLDHPLQVSLDLTTNWGASAWLSALLQYGFTLHKAAFHDAITL